MGILTIETGTVFNVLTVLGETSFSYWIVLPGLNTRQMLKTYCNSICHTLLISIRDLPFSEQKQRRNVLDVGFREVGEGMGEEERGKTEVWI